jgi:DNA-binding transcriptional ArsR family regulator
MNTTPTSPPVPQNPPLLPLAPVAAALNDPKRWAILAELSLGEPLMVKEIAQRLRRPPTTISKHLAVLRAAGMVVIGRGGLYQIPSQFLISRELRHVDFGHCLLRLPETSAQE